MSQLTFRLFVSSIVIGAILAIGIAVFHRPAVKSTLVKAGPTGVAKTDSVAPAIIAPPPSNDYAGSQTCAKCHAEITERFRAHPMGHSLAKVTEAQPMETYGEKSRFEVPISAGSTFRLSYAIDKTDAGVIHRETAIGKDGNVLYEREVPVQFAIGSGQRGRSYVVNHEGLMYMSPATWYSEGKRWDLSPGYQLKNLHFGRRILDGCVHCHAGRTDFVGDFPDHFRAEPFIEESISCERCHGPSKDHVDHWMNERGKSESDPILKVGQLTAALQNDICFQCHLIGEQRITRVGRTDFDFRPGKHLEDVWTIVVKGAEIAPDRTMEAVSQVEQMLGSKCYQRSDGQLKCSTCHDPHLRPSEQERDAIYRTSCLKCHGSNTIECSQSQETRLAATAVDSCIHCHMPKAAANDVPHTSHTDHRVLRRPAASTSSQKRHSELIIFNEAKNTAPRSEIDRAQAIAMVRIAENMGKGIAGVDAVPKLERWIKANPKDITAIEALGFEYFLLKDYSRATSNWESGLAQSPNHEILLRRLFLLAHETQQLEKAKLYGQRLVSINPWEYEYLGRYAHVLSQSNQLSEAADFGERALKINPSAFHIHSWLSSLYSLQGDETRSLEHRLKYEAFSK